MAGLAEHLKTKNSMNPKLADFAVELGHLNAAVLKDFVDFIRSGEPTDVDNVQEDAATPPADATGNPEVAAPEATPADATSADAPQE